MNVTHLKVVESDPKINFSLGLSFNGMMLTGNYGLYFNMLTLAKLYGNGELGYVSRIRTPLATPCVTFTHVFTWKMLRYLFFRLGELIHLLHAFLQSKGCVVWYKCDVIDKSRCHCQQHSAVWGLEHRRGSSTVESESPFQIRVNYFWLLVNNSAEPTIGSWQAWHRYTCFRSTWKTCWTVQNWAPTPMR